MKKIMMSLLLSLFSISAFADELFVFIRHAEKPEAGLGQLNCKGLDRALALPKVLEAKYGKADVLFAPNPTILKDDKGVKYPYLRPLATIEPTAIGLGKSVNIDYAFTDSEAMVKELQKTDYDNKTVVIAWEHHLAVKIVKELVNQYDSEEAKKVPAWPNDDFDSIYVVRVFDVEGKKFVTFELEKQNLDNYLKFANCPNK